MTQDELFDLIETSPSVAWKELLALIERSDADDLPMLGHSKVVPGLIYATAHYRNGVMFAPLTVKLVGDMVFGRAADPAQADLDPSRFGSVRL